MRNRLFSWIAAVALTFSAANLALADPLRGESVPLPKARPGEVLPPVPDAKPAAPVAVPVPSDRPEAVIDTPVPPMKSTVSTKNKAPLFADDAISPACEAIEEGRVSGRPLKPIEDPAGCVVPEIYAISSLGAERSVKLSTEAKLNCAMVDRLDRFVEEVIEPAAREYFESGLVGLGVAGSYVCRPRNGQPSAKPSQHGKANAIDISRFILADGRVISVEAGWVLGDLSPDESPEAPEAAADPSAEVLAETPAGEKTEESEAVTQPEEGEAAIPVPEPKPQPDAQPEPDIADTSDDSAGPPEGASASADNAVVDPEAAKADSFLRVIHAAACGPFTTVIGPDGDEHHRDHFHFDLATRGKSGQSTFCQ